MSVKVAELKTIRREDCITIYSICFDGADETEFQKFVGRFKDNAKLNRDYRTIILAVEKIASAGALERWFRPEGKMSDRVAALAIDSRKMRLYCLRISDQILILGNGGVKNTRTYEESEELNGYVMDLQSFDRMLRQEEKRGTITIERSTIEGMDGKIFNL